MNTPSFPLSTQKLIEKYEAWNNLQKPEENISTIHVDEVASKVAAFYEKMRGIVEWKEEHLLKRRAIERILKRKIFLEDRAFSEALVLELIRGGHLTNDKIEERKVPQIQETINKYLYILDNFPPDKEPKIQFYNWLLEIAACEIEEILSSSIKERALITYMFDAMKDKIRVSEKLISVNNFTKEKQETQTYIAVQRALFKLDSPVITYHLLKHYYPNWKNISQKDLEEITKDIHIIKKGIENSLNHPLADKFYQICEKYDSVYLIFGDVLSQNVGQEKETLMSPQKMENEIAKAYEKRLKTLKKRLTRAAVYSTISIFVTHIFLLLLIEMPINKLLMGYYFNFLAIFIDIIVPTILMFLLVSTAKFPNKENLPRIIMEVMKIIYQKKEKEIYEIKTFGKRNAMLSGIINLFYFAGFLAILTFIVWCLSKINFPLFSYFVFIVFLSLVAFAGTKIRQRAEELQVLEEREPLIYFLIDPFAVPIIQLGNWLTNKWKKYNIIAVFFSALIDMPFSIFIEFIEQWRYFLKEKKEKIH